MKFVVYWRILQLAGSSFRYVWRCFNRFDFIYRRLIIVGRIVHRNKKAIQRAQIQRMEESMDDLALAFGTGSFRSNASSRGSNLFSGFQSFVDTYLKNASDLLSAHCR